MPKQLSSNDKQWTFFVVRCIKKKFDNYSTSVAFHFEMFLSPRFAQQGVEYKKVFYSLRKADEALASYFSALEFDFIEVDHAISVRKNKRVQSILLSQDRNSTKCLVSLFSVGAWVPPDVHADDLIISSTDVRLWLDAPGPFGDALVFFNAFSDAKQTNILWLNEVYVRMKALQDYCWRLKSPRIDEGVAPFACVKNERVLQDKLNAKIVCERVREVQSALWNVRPSGSNRFEDFFEEYLLRESKDLAERKVINLCWTCCNPFPFRESKRYCSLKCAKNARNRRSYVRRVKRLRAFEPTEITLDLPRISSH
jgi:hypothetical protein